MGRDSHRAAAGAVDDARTPPPQFCVEHAEGHWCELGRGGGPVVHVARTVEPSVVLQDWVDAQVRDFVEWAEVRLHRAQMKSISTRGFARSSTRKFTKTANW